MKLTAFLGLLAAALIAAVTLTSSPAWADGESLHGALEVKDKPVEGVKIIVKTADGEDVGTATSDAEGKWEVEVPAAGDYTVRLDTKTLPDGVRLHDPKRDELTVGVFEGNPRAVLFRLTTGKPGGEKDKKNQPDERKYSRAAQLTYDGLNFGLIVAMAAVGLSLVFGTTGLVNFSHGELVTLGAMIAFLFNVVMGVPLVIAAVLAVLACAVFGYGQDRFFWGKLRERGSGVIAMMIISIGLSIVLRYGYTWWFGRQSRPFADYVAQPGIDLGYFSATPKSLITVVLSILILVGVGFALLRTRMGKAIRAVADNRSLAAVSGIDVDKVTRTVWTAGTALAGLAGILLAMGLQVHFQLGFHLLLMIFAGVILGGLGTAFGALLGGLLVGMMMQLSTLVVPPELKNLGALAVLILVLLVRPQGLLGRRERVG